jgi:hypothetical protein
MDVPLVLERLRPLVLWGPNSGSNSTYAELVSTWPATSGDPPTLAEMEAEWQAISNQNGGIVPGTIDYRDMQLLSIPAPNARRLGANLSSSVVALQDVGGLRFPVAANRHYTFEFHGAWTTIVNTTGIRLAVNCPPSPAVFGVQGFVWESQTAHRAGVTGTPDQALVGQSGLAGVSLPWSVRGNLSTGAQGGWLALRGASEVAGSQVTILAGSYGTIWGVG